MAQTVIDIGIEDKLLKLVEKIAKIQHRSKSEVIRDSISRYAKSFFYNRRAQKNSD